MSLFGMNVMGDLDDDPIFGSHMRSIRRMNSMLVNSMFNDPFGMMVQHAITDSPHQPRGRTDMQLMPFGFPVMPAFNMDRFFMNFNDMAGNPNCHSFTSRSVMTMASGPDGRPQVYQETMSTTTAPGGVKETKKTVCDSRTGTKKLAIGHHIGERAHILEREHNIHNGEQEERQEFINLDEDEAESFNNEWEACTRRAVGHRSIAGANYSARGGHKPRSEQKQLALPEPSSSRLPSHSRWTPSPRRSIRPLTSTNCSPLSKARSKRSSTPPDHKVPTSSTGSGNRKREHTPETTAHNKRHVASNSHV